jgi:hypothetical protein
MAMLNNQMVHWKKQLYKRWRYYICRYTDIIWYIYTHHWQSQRCLIYYRCSAGIVLAHWWWINIHGPTCHFSRCGIPRLYLTIFTATICLRTVSPRILENTSLHLVNCCSDEDVIETANDQENKHQICQDVSVNLCLQVLAVCIIHW